MKKLILAFAFLSLPSFADMYDFPLICKESGGLIVESEIVHAMSVISHSTRSGSQFKAVVETKPTTDALYDKRVFLISQADVIDIAYRAYDTLKFVDICYITDGSWLPIATGMRIRDK